MITGIFLVLCKLILFRSSKFCLSWYKAIQIIKILSQWKRNNLFKDYVYVEIKQITINRVCSICASRKWLLTWRRASTRTRSCACPSTARAPPSGPTWPSGPSSTRCTPTTCAGSSRFRGYSKFTSTLRINPSHFSARSSCQLVNWLTVK